MGETNPPEFKDGGNTVKTMQKEWKCDAIEFSQPADNTKDSALTIRIVNSKSVANTPNGERFEQAKSIASQIRRVLANPERFSEYNITWVKEEGSIIWRSRTFNTSNVPVSLLPPDHSTTTAN